MYQANYIKPILTIFAFIINLYGSAQSGKEASQVRLLETIPFIIHTGGVITVQAYLGNNSLPLNFILDTGSGGISLDSSTCKELNLTVIPSDTSISGIAGTKKVSFVFDQQIKTGKLVTDNVDFYVNDYRLLSTLYGEKIDGIIGYSFLSRYIMDINFDSGYIKIYKPGPFNYQMGGTTLHPLFSRLAAQPVFVKDNVKTVSNFYLDTGAGLCLLLTEQFIKDKNMILPRRKPVLTQAEGLGGKKNMLLTVVKTLRLGPYKFKNVPTYLYNDEANITSYPFTGGLIGNDLMRRFNITLNYPRKEIYVIPNSHFNDKFDYAYTGMSLYYIDEKVYADDIIPGSPADKAEIKNGDEIISVSNIFKGNIQDYKSLLQKAREAVKLIIKRDDKLFFVSLNPASIL